MSEKRTMVSSASDADFAAFQAGDEQRIKDLAEFMQGSAVQEGGQHDMFPRGLSTDNGEWQQPADTTEQVPLVQSPSTFAPAPAEVEIQRQADVTSTQAPAQPGQDWRKLYGQSENEKGELRKALQQQMEANSQLLNQMQQFVIPPQQPSYPSYQNVTPPPYSPNNGYPPYQQFSNVPPNNPYYQPPVIPRRFVDKNDGEMMVTEDVEGAIRGSLSMVAPVVAGAHEEARLAREEAAQLKQLVLAQEKERRGVTPQLEAQALLERPWIRNLQHNNAAYLGALGDYAVAKNAQALLQRTQSPQQLAPQMPATASAAARRVTYIENSTPATQEPGNTASAFDQEFKVAMKEVNLAKRAAKMREVFAKYGIRESNDWRDPSVVTR